MNLQSSKLQLMTTLHPMAVAGFFVEYFTILLIFNHPIIAIAQLVVISLMIAFNYGSHALLSQLKYTGLFLLMIIAFNLLLNQKWSPTFVSFSIFKVTFVITLPALLYGLTMGILIINMLISFMLFNTYLPPNKLIYVLQPMAPRLALLISMTIHFTEALGQQAKAMMALMRVRGITMSEGPVRTRFQAGTLLLKALFSQSLTDAMDTATLMEARGFGGTKRTHYRTFHWMPRDTNFSVFVSGLFLILLGLRLTGWGWLTSVGDFSTWYFIHDLPLTILIVIFLCSPILAEGVFRLWTN